MEKLVLSALQRVPSIQAACEEDALSLSVEIRREGWVPMRGAGKRRIEDSRE